MDTLKLKGLVAAVVSPMHSDGELNLGMVPRVVEHLRGRSVVGAYIAGSTGEGMSLTSDERRAVAEAYVAACRGHLCSIVQVGHNSLKQSAALAAHAEKIGADAVSATPPGYFKPGNEADLVEALLPVVKAAPATPFYYYHIPALSGVQIDPIRFTDLAMDRLPTFCGIKYSDSATIHNLPLLKKVGPGLEFLCGTDEGYLQGLAQGYEGAVGSTYNYASPIYDRVRSAFEAGDIETAREWQGHALEMIQAMFSTCGRGSLKAMMRMVGLDCGPVRLPLEPPTEEQVAMLRKQLVEMGWFEWVGLEAAMAA